VAEPAGANDQVPRERGWIAILLSLVVFLLVPKLDPLRLLAPIEQTVLLLVPAIAVCALIAWRSGGRFWLGAAWVAVTAWMLWQPIPGAGAYDSLARGWAVLLAASFGVVNIVAAGRPFLARGLLAVALTFAVSTTTLLLVRVSPSRVEGAVSADLDRRLASADARLARDTQSATWQRMSANRPSLSRTLEDYRNQLQQLPRVTLAFFPALLALESLATLGLGWGLFHRISRTRVGPPLSPLRSFRLSEELVWGLLAGVAILVLPPFRGMQGLGINLSLFFGALYALRGLGVMSWLMASRALAVTLLALVAFLLWPRMVQVVFIAAVGLGLADNWIDWRRPARQVT
jgi:hypothetical protein